MKLDEHELLKKCVRLLLGPRPIPSKAELAKRMQCTDDSLCRAIDRFERERGFTLIVMKNGRLALTEKGRLAYQYYGMIWGLGESEEFVLANLNLQAESILGGLLSAALVSVFDMWGSRIDRPMIWRLETDIRRSIAEGKADLGLGFADAEDVVGNEEALGSPVEWCVLAKVGNPLGESMEPLPVDQLPNSDWLLLPDLAFGATGLAEVFLRAGQKRLMACEHLPTYVSAGVGLAVLPNVLGGRCPHGTIKRRLVGLPALRTRLFLPRRGGSALSSQNQCLVETLHRLVRDGFFGSDDHSDAPETVEGRVKQEMSPAEPAVEVVDAALLKEPGRQLEGALS